LHAPRRGPGPATRSAARTRQADASTSPHSRYIDVPLTNSYKDQIDDWLAEYTGEQGE
jgi:hypothetical protein